MSFVERLREGANTAREQTLVVKQKTRPSSAHWPAHITRLRGRMAAGGSEWISARDVFEMLGIQTAAKHTCSRHVSGLMKAAGWRPALVGPRHARQRGYIRTLEVYNTIKP